jgi:hypothetical protein
MEWLRKWLDRRRVKALKLKIARMKVEAKAAEVEPLMPAVETISGRIRRERLVVLERAVEKIDLLQTPGAQSSACNPNTGNDKA